MGFLSNMVTRTMVTTTRRAGNEGAECEARSYFFMLVSTDRVLFSYITFLLSIPILLSCREGPLPMSIESFYHYPAWRRTNLRRPRATRFLPIPTTCPLLRPSGSSEFLFLPSAILWILPLFLLGG